MKFLFISLLLSLATVAMANKSGYSKLRKRISDDENTLSIQIDGNQNGRTIHYKHTFDVAGMSNLRKEVLKYRVFHSLGVAVPFHEMPWCISVAAGLVVLDVTLFLVGYRALKVDPGRGNVRR